MRELDPERIREDWEEGWKMFDSTLEDLGIEAGTPWDPWALAVFLDVPAYALTGVLTAARALGLAEGLDLVARVRDGLRRALARLREAGVPDADGPLPLEFGLTGLLLRWEWLELLGEGRAPDEFFERLRRLRIRLPEVALCERTVWQFCRRIEAVGVSPSP